MNARNCTKDDITKFIQEISDPKITHDNLYKKRKAEMVDIDVSFYSALVNAADGSAWGDDILQIAQDELATRDMVSVMTEGLHYFRPTLPI